MTEVRRVDADTCELPALVDWLDQTAASVVPGELPGSEFSRLAASEGDLSKVSEFQRPW